MYKNLFLFNNDISSRFQVSTLRYRYLNLKDLIYNVDSYIFQNVFNDHKNEKNQHNADIIRY